MEASRRQNVMFRTSVAAVVEVADEEVIISALTLVAIALTVRNQVTVGVFRAPVTRMRNVETSLKQ